MYWIWLIACNDIETPNTSPKPEVQQQKQQPQTRPIPPSQQNNRKPNIQNGPPSLPGSSPQEDLSTSWRKTLNIPTLKSPIITNKFCPDVDGDGFVDANACGDQVDISEADCDDNDSNVTPKTERYIRQGRFIMGSASNHAGSDESPVHAVFVSGYCLDTDEVSTQDFTTWLTAHQRLPQGKDIRSMNIVGNSVTPEDGRSNHPAEGVTWIEARDYCVDQGQQLPTEAQWEKAARGGCEFGDDTENCDSKDLRAYPWGNQTPTCELANHQLSTTGLPKLCVSDTLLPEALPAGNGPYGNSHLAGNVWEYVADVWHPLVYSDQPRENPAGVNSGDVHVLRGGGWNTFSTNMRTANRFHDLVMGSASGFRCARTFTPSTFDDVEPLVFSPLSGTITSPRPLSGRALYVSAFSASDADSRGMLIPGRSPVAEIRLTPNDAIEQPFTIDLPHGVYIVSAALDSGLGANKEDYVSASGSGGFGHAKQNPITVKTSVANIQIEMRSAPMMPKPQNPPNPPKKP